MKKHVLTVILIIVLIAVFVPLIQWAAHPELTSMEVFLDFWWLYLMAILFTYVGLKHFVK